MLVTNIAQIVVAIVVVIALFIAGFSVYNSELVKSYENSRKIKISTVVFSGVQDLTQSNNLVYDTHDSTNGTYRNIANSMNQQPGAEFTYNFWLFKDNAAQTAIPDVSSVSAVTDPGIQTTDIVLLVKGERTAVTYGSLCSGVFKTDVLTKCPLIKLERAMDVLTVEFNTLASPDVVQQASRNTCSDVNVSWSAKNSHKLSISNLRDTNYQQKWFMVTVVVEDTFPSDPLPGRNRVRCRIYINGRLELDKYVDSGMDPAKGTTNVISALKTNDGNLQVAPAVTTLTGGSTSGASLNIGTLKATQLMMSDLTYYNYDLDPATIKSLYISGPSLVSNDNKEDMTKVSLHSKSPATIGTSLTAKSPIVPYPIVN